LATFLGKTGVRREKRRCKKRTLHVGRLFSQLRGTYFWVRGGEESEKGGERNKGGG